MQAGGQEFDSPRLHQHRPKAGNLFLENYTEEERKKDFTKEEIILRTEGNSNKAKKVKVEEKDVSQDTKGVRWMPWRYLPKKDATSCEKLRRDANDL